MKQHSMKRDKRCFFMSYLKADRLAADRDEKSWSSGLMNTRFEIKLCANPTWYHTDVDHDVLNKEYS
jgi:hypothetical protein